MNTATIRFFTLLLKRFRDRDFLAAFSLHQLIFYYPENLAWND